MSQPSVSAVSAMLCSPQVITAGSVVSCELHVIASAQPVTVRLNSSSEQVLVPPVVVTRSNQSTLTFQAQTSPSSGQQTVTITATLGTTDVADTMLLLAPSGPVLRVPAKEVVKAGETIAFTVSAIDPGNLPVQLGVKAIPIGASFDSAAGVFQWTPQPSHTGKYRITFTATNSARQSSTAQVDLEVDSGLPALNKPESSCSPGAIATLTGKWLAPPGSQFSDPTGASFDLGGTKVAVNGQVVPLVHCRADRVDFLCPATGTETALSVEVTSRFGSSQPVKMTATEASPAILSMDDSPENQGWISFNGMSDLVMERNFRVPSHPAQPGDQIVIFATGLGSAADSPAGIVVKLGDADTGVESVQAVPGRAGVYAVRVRVPAAVTFGAEPVELQITTLDGHLVHSNSVTAVFEAVRQ